MDTLKEKLKDSMLKSMPSTVELDLIKNQLVEILLISSMQTIKEHLTSNMNLD